MAIEGPLRELGIHDVFQLLDLSRKTGIFRVTSELRHNEGKVYFDSGAVVYAEIRSNPHQLGGLLVRAGKIDDADLTRARETQRRGDRRRLGQILVGLGAITERELERYVRQQVEEVVFELMNWHEGQFSFAEESPTDAPADLLVRIPTEALLMEGARRIDEWSLIERKIPRLSVVPELAPNQSGGEGALDLLPSEWEVLVAADGARDVRAIAELLGRSEFDTAKTVFGLESAGVVVLKEGVAAGEAAADSGVDEVASRAESALAKGDPETARAELEAILPANPGEVRLHLLLGQAHLAAGRVTEAEEVLHRALRLDPSAAPAHRLLGNVLALRGRFGEAAERWERWLDQARAAGETKVERDRVKKAVRAARDLETAVRARG